MEMKPSIKQLLKGKYNLLCCCVSDVIFKIWALQKKNNKVAKTITSKKNVTTKFMYFGII